jgi:RecA/RadA recombinase
MDKNKLKSIHEAIMKPKKVIINKHYFPTGSDLLDIVVGGGEGFGYPIGKIINLVGDKSSGKTFLACEIIAATYYHPEYKNKLKWVYDDCESGFSFDTKKLYGFEIMPFKDEKRTKSKTVEDAYCNVRSFFEKLTDDEYGIYVIDSLDALNDKEGKKIADEQFTRFKKRKESPEEKEEKEKGSYRMGKAKYLSNTFFPNLADLIEKKNGLLIIISQVRCNLDPFSFEKYARAGGKAMDFYAHTVLWLANVNKIMKKDRAVGITVKAQNNKSKTPRPYRSTFIKILFDYGIDNIQSNIDYVFDLLTPRGQLVKNPKAKWSDKTLNLEGIKAFLIEYNIEEKYRKEVNAKLKVSEVMKWLEDNKDDFIKKAYIAEFSDSMNRKDLIEFVSNNNLKYILRKKVVDKWEAIEESVKSNLPPKYSEG